MATLVVQTKCRSIPALFVRLFSTISVGPGSLQEPKSSTPIVDRRRVKCRGGRGGNGKLAYKKHAEHHLSGPGYPCGGSGGSGGSVVVTVSSSVCSLKHISGNALGGDGGCGKNKNYNGIPGNDFLIKVPFGTIVYRVHQVIAKQNNRKCFEKSQLADMIDEHSAPLVICRGGRGGRGNTYSDPYKASPGEGGEEIYIELELKSLADIGLVGLPNAGKSTLLGAVSRSCPKIAPYPFTTLAPHIGRVEYSDGRIITVADLPGLVYGAHRDVGLGHDFLRHVERTHVLVYVLDASSSWSHPLNDFKCLRDEVEAYSESLTKKRFCVVANKCDILPETTLRRVDEVYYSLKECGLEDVEVIPISARHGDGIQTLLRHLHRLCNQSFEEMVFEEPT